MPHIHIVSCAVSEHLVVFSQGDAVFGFRSLCHDDVLCRVLSGCEAHVLLAVVLASTAGHLQRVGLVAFHDFDPVSSISTRRCLIHQLTVVSCGQFYHSALLGFSVAAHGSCHHRWILYFSHRDILRLCFTRCERIVVDSIVLVARCLGCEGVFLIYILSLDVQGVFPFCIACHLVLRLTACQRHGSTHDRLSVAAHGSC